MLDLSKIYHCVFTEWKSMCKYSEFVCIADGELIVNCLELQPLETAVGKSEM